MLFTTQHSPLARSSTLARLGIIVVVIISVLVMQPQSAAWGAAGHAPNAVCNSNGSGSWGSPSTWTCGLVPGSADDVTIMSGHTVTLDTTRYAHNLLNYGTLNMSGNSFDLNGSYYGYGGQVTGGGTFNVSGGTGTDICAGNSQANYSGVGVNLVPAGNGTVTCTYGMNAGGLWVPQGTLALSGNSNFGWIVVYANGTLDTGSTSSTTTGSITNNGTIRATRNSPGASSTSFGLAGGASNGFVVQPLTGGFSQLVLDWHGTDHPYKTGTSVTSGVGWGEYWVLSVTGSDTARVTIPAQLFTPGANSKVCYAASSTWTCAMTAYDAVSTPNTVTVNPVAISTNLAWAAGNVGPTAVTLKDLAATSNSIDTGNLFSLALGGLLALGLGGWWIARRFAAGRRSGG